MDTDTTLNFGHSAGHPAVVYAPQHLVRVPISEFTYGCIAAALLLLSLTVLVAVKRHKRRLPITLALAFLTLISGAAALSTLAMRGYEVKALDTKSHDFDQSYPGDDIHQFFFTREAALNQAKETGQERGLPESTARARAISWKDIPAEDRKYADVEGINTDTFPKDAGWSEADHHIVQEYLKQVYGITETAEKDNKIWNYTQAVAYPGMDSETALQSVQHSTLMKVPGDPLHTDGGYEHYQCLVHLTSYRQNATGQPLSAVPGKVECFSSYETDHITPSTRRVVPVKLSH